jgi:large subunit ribosomal protein L21
MYAVIQTGGKQYRAEPGQTLWVEKLPGDKGDQITFDQVLLVAQDDRDVAIGTPIVAGATVTAQIVEQGLGEKLVVFKFRRRKNYVRRNGHRQELTAIKIESIVG